VKNILVVADNFKINGLRQPRILLIRESVANSSFWFFMEFLGEKCLLRIRSAKSAEELRKSVKDAGIGSSQAWRVSDSHCRLEIAYPGVLHRFS